MYDEADGCAVACWPAELLLPLPPKAGRKPDLGAPGADAAAETGGRAGREFVPGGGG